MLDMLSKIVSWVRAEQKAKQRADLEFLASLFIFGPSYLIVSRWVMDEQKVVVLAAAITLPTYLGVRRYILRIINRPITDEPSPSPLAELSRYELSVEKEKAERAGNVLRVKAIEAEVSQRD